MKTKRFTFPELVFSLSALALMAFLMLSAVAAVRENGKSVLCSSQLNAMGKLALSYNSTYKCIPITPLWNTGKKVVSTNYLYLYWKLGLMGKEKGTGSPGNCFFSKEFFCPSLLERGNISNRTAAKGKWYSSNCSYGVRRDTRTVEEGIRNYWRSDYFDLNKLNKPSQMNFYGCASRRTTKRAIRFYFSRISAGNIDFLTGVHAGKAAVWVMDGHAELINRKQLEGKFGGNTKCWNE